MQLYPVNLNLQGRRCVVVGGGRVAWRKVCGLCRAGAKVKVISPRLTAELQEMAEQGAIEWREGEFAAGDLHGAFLVFAATDSPAVQQLVRQEAVVEGALVNMASEPSGSDFHVPGHFRRGDILVTVSTGGNSPAIAAKLRASLEEKLHPGYEDVVSFFAVLRREVLRCDNDAEKHGKLFRDLLDGGIVEQILAGEWNAVLLLLNSFVPQEINGYKLIAAFLAEREADISSSFSEGQRGDAA